MIKSNRSYLFGIGVVATIRHGPVQCVICTAPEGLFKGYSTVVTVGTATSSPKKVVAKAMLNPVLSKAARSESHALVAAQIEALLERNFTVIAAANEVFSVAKESNHVVHFVVASEDMPLGDALKSIVEGNQRKTDEDTARLTSPGIGDSGVDQWFETHPGATMEDYCNAEFPETTAEMKAEQQLKVANEETTAKAHEAMLVLREHFEGRSSSDKLALIDAIETGTPACDSTYNEIAAPIRTINEKWVEFIRSFQGEPFRLFLLNYYPHILKPDEFTEARRFQELKLERSPAYLKHRSLPTARQCVEAGFHLVSDNPADYFLTRWSLIDKFSSEQCAQPKAMADAISAVAEANALQIEQDARLLKDLVARISAEIDAPAVYVSQEGPGRATVHPRLLEELKKPGNERLFDLARYW